MRVPPSAWITSQSTMIWRSPSVVQVDDRAQATADQPLDLLRAARLLALGRLAVAAGVGRARQHAIFGGDPALALAAQERRNLFLDAGGARARGIAEADQAGSLGMTGEAGLDGEVRASGRARGRTGAWNFS